mgnify:CR=1 FL=1
MPFSNPIAPVFACVMLISSRKNYLHGDPREKFELMLHANQNVDGY